MRIRLTLTVALVFILSLPALIAGHGAIPALADGLVTLIATQTDVGTVLFTDNGRALYVFSYDSVGTNQSPARSFCTGTCTTPWSPLVAPGPNGPFQISGDIQMSRLGTIARLDAQGQTVYQVTYFGHPLYMFVNDRQPAQTNGQNAGSFNGYWNLVGTNGTPVSGPASVILESTSNGPALAVSTSATSYRSLYMLTLDPPTGTICYGGCARFWPPLLTTGKPTAGPGLDPNALGTVRRADGTQQVTYFGVPLYLYAFDLASGAKPGLTNGENSLDTNPTGFWYLVSPDGSALSNPAPVGASASDFGNILNYNGTVTLYTFGRDTPGSSACNDVCARMWLPLLSNGAPQVAAGSSLNANLVSTLRRTDGSTQVLYNGHPLYMFALDFFGTSGQHISAFGGTFDVIQASGSISTSFPAKRPVTAIPQLRTSGNNSTASFVVAFSSANAGAGRVYFGSGPGCSGLIEVATNDSGTGTTNHSVTVTGNDLPGSSGNNGLQPGTTYYYEVVTVGAAGSVTNDNEGKCYSVTTPTA